MEQIRPENKKFWKVFWPSSKSIFNCHSPKGIKLITRLRLGLSHLCEHKFQLNFQDILHLICRSGDDIETTIHYLLHCPNFLDEMRTLLDNLRSIGENIHDKNYSQMSELLLFGVFSIMMHQIHVFWMLRSNTYCLLKDLTSLLLKSFESFEIFTFFNTYVNTTVTNNCSHKI